MIRGFDNEEFQRKIDARVGLNRDGKSILRLMYAPQVMTWAMGEHVPRYWTKRWKQGGAWKYEQPDRFVFEKRLERESYWEAHQATRFQQDPESGEVTDLGPPPEDFYVFDSLIAVHDGFRAESGEPQCCEEAWNGETKYRINDRLELISEPVGGRRRCWGRYRDPNDSDLENIERAVREMCEGPYYNPYLPLTPEQLASLEVEANLNAQRVADEATERLRENSDDFQHTHGWRLRESSAKRLSHGRYHFMGNSWKAGKHGLAIPA
jgi:hypothetical protein